MKGGKIFNCKRGMSHHVEMVIAFVLFIMFVFFVLVFVRPHDNNYLSGSVVYGAHYNFLENAREDVLKIFVNISNYTDDTDNDCVRVDLPHALVGEEYKNGVVIPVGDGQVGYHYDEENHRLAIERDNNGSYYVFLSDFFEESPTSCNNGTMYNVSFGSFSEEKILSEVRLREMAQEYRDDYEGLRVKLGIPYVYDYSIVSDVVSMEKERPLSVEVLSRDYIDKVIFDDGLVKFERFTIKIWR